VSGKTRILIVSDSPAIDSGMGVAHAQIAQRLFNTGKYEVASFGWFWNSAVQRGIKWPYKWKQYTLSSTDKPYGHPANWPNSSEKDFKDTALYQVIHSMFKPHVVIALGDYWMVDFIYYMPNYDSFKFIHEIPIDGEPIPKSWTGMLRQANVLISMSEYGKRVIQQRDKTCNVTVNPRGIDIGKFFKIKASKDMIRRQTMPSCVGRFVVGVFDRFQDRKQVGRSVEAFSKFISDGKHDNCDLYLHMDVNDPFTLSQKKTLVGEDGIIGRYGIKEHVVVNNDVCVEKGVPVDRLNMLYNCCDVKLSSTQGEGWGLTTAEAMACELPCIATDYTTMPELLGRDSSRGLLAKVNTYITGQHNIERALVDTDDIAQKLDMLYRSPSLRTKLGRNAREYISQFRWDTNIKQWEKIIDDCLDDNYYTLIENKPVPHVKMNDVNIYGAVREHTGWAITTRGFARGFKSNGWNVKITEGGGKSSRFKCPNDITEMMAGEEPRYLSIINHMPQHALKFINADKSKHKIAYFPFELNTMKSDVVEMLNRRVDVFACPTKFTADIARNSGVSNIAIVPLASDIDVNAKPAELNTKKGYKFLMLGNLGDVRKNTILAIKAYMCAFTDDDDVCLVLKSMPGHTNSDPTQLVEMEKLGHQNPPEVIVVHQEDDDEAKYYAACDCLLMPSRCEGWGHPVFQALMFGMPIIASNYGGYLDFVNRGKNIQLITGDMGEASASPNFTSNEYWFNIDFNELIGALKKAHGVDMRKTGENYVSDYTWGKTANTLIDIYEGIRKKPKTKVYFERMVKNLWNSDNEVGFKMYAPSEYEFVNSPKNADFQILDITRISDKLYLRHDKYVVLFHCFGEWSEEDKSEYEELFRNAIMVYSHIDLTSMFPNIDSNKFMRGPWGSQPDFWFYRPSISNDVVQILCTGEIAVTEGIRECIAACDLLGRRMLHVGHNLNFRNKSYSNVTNLTILEMRDAYNQSKWVSGLRRIEGFEKPVVEGLLCGARPICFDTPLYRYWYGDLARYVKEGTEEETFKDIVRVMKEEYAPVTQEEMERAIKKFSWKYVSRNFWNNVTEIMEATC